MQGYGFPLMKVFLEKSSQKGQADPLPAKTALRVPQLAPSD